MQTFTTSTSGRREVRLSKLKQIDVLLHLVENGPGRTETELAQAIFGHKGYRQQVNPDCVRLARSGGEVASCLGRHSGFGLLGFSTEP